MYEPKFDRQKFRELTLHIAHRSHEDPWFGAVKLNKILYYCDFIAFARFSEPITGATYVKYPEGPVPREMLKERAAWVSEGLAEIHMREVFRYTQHRLVPKGDYDELSGDFSDNERAIVEEVLSSMRSMTAKEASDMSHEELGWILAQERTDIPYETAWLVPKSDIEMWSMDTVNSGRP